MEIKAKSHLLVLQSLYDAFDHFNKHFNGDDLLPTPVINLGSAGKRAAYGWFRPNSWFAVKSENQEIDTSSDTGSLPEINISPEYLYRKPEDVLETLIHEIAHLHNDVLGIPDCSKTQYHNRAFKERAENYGLKVDKMKYRGWAHTSLDEKAKEAIKSLPFDINVFALTRPRRIKPSANPYITITLRRDEWEDQLESLMDDHNMESKSEVIKHALNNLIANP